MMACLSAEAMARIARVKKIAYFMELFEGGMVLDTNPTPVLVQPMEIKCLPFVLRKEHLQLGL